MAGKRHRLRSDADHANHHSVGASVTVIQLLEHDPFGTIAFPWQANTWAHHYDATALAVDRLDELSPHVLAVEVDSAGSRVLTEESLLRAIYQTGTSGVINAYLAVQHYCERLESITHAPIHDGAPRERLLACTQSIGLDATDHRAYWSLAEVVRVRNAIEHPQAQTSYAGENGTWDRVPLAWMISNRSVKTLRCFLEWFDYLAAGLIEFERNPKPQIVTLDIGMRGVVSDAPAKKPPRKSLQ